MKRRFIANIVGIVILAIVASTIIIYAWYTNTKKSESIDYVSNGLVISYKIENETNVENYNVENVVFFDADST